MPTVTLGSDGAVNRSLIQAAVTAAIAGDTIVLAGDGGAQHRPLTIDGASGYGFQVTKPLNIVSNTLSATGLILDVGYTSASTPNFPVVIDIPDAAEGSSIKLLGLDCSGATVTTLNKELGGISTSLGAITLEDLDIQETRIGWVLLHGTQIIARRLNCRSLKGPNSNTGHHGFDFDERTTGAVMASGLVEDCSFKNLIGDSLKIENSSGVIVRGTTLDGRVVVGQNDVKTFLVGDYLFEDNDIWSLMWLQDVVAAAAGSGGLQLLGNRFRNDNAYAHIASASFDVGGAFEPTVQGNVFSGRNSIVAHYGAGAAASGRLFTQAGFAAVNTGARSRLTRFVRPSTTYFFIGAITGYYSPETTSNSIAVVEAARVAGDDMVLLPGDYKTATSQVNTTVAKSGRLIFDKGARINGANQVLARGMNLVPTAGTLEVHGLHVTSIVTSNTTAGGIDVNPSAGAAVNFYGRNLVENIRPDSAILATQTNLAIRLRGAGDINIYGTLLADNCDQTGVTTASGDGKIIASDGTGVMNVYGGIGCTNSKGAGTGGSGMIALKQAGEINNLLAIGNTNALNLTVFLGAGAKTIRNPTLLDNTALTNPGFGGYSNTNITWAVSGGIMWGNGAGTFNADPTSSVPPTGAALTFDNCVIEDGQSSTTKITATNIYEWNPQIESDGSANDASNVSDLVTKWWSNGARPVSFGDPVPDDNIKLGAVQ